MIARYRRRLLALGLLIVLSLLFFHQLAFDGKILARGDTFEYFYPYWDARNQAFRQGRLPLWTPDLFMGAPLLANPQLGGYYPPNWLTAPFRAPSAITLSILFHIALAGAGACWLYRETVSKRWIPALAAAVVYAFSGFLGAHVEQINQLQGLAWLPLLFALYSRLLTRDRPMRDGLLLAMAWALQIFSGHTQTVFISAVGLVGFALAQAALNGERGPRSKMAGRGLLMLGCCSAVAICLALPQLLPSLELLRLSIRSGGLEAHSVSAFSLPPDLLGRALLPSYDGQIFGEYVGTIGVIGLGLAFWAIASRPRSDRPTWIWLCLAALGLLLALGNHNPLYRLLDALPPLNYFRAPARFLALFTLGMAMLAGMGVAALETSAKPAPRKPRRIARALGPILLLIALTALIRPANPEMIFGDSSISAGALGRWLGAALLLLGLLLARWRFMPVAALALLAGELFPAGRNLPYNDLSPPEVYLGQRASITALLSLQAEEPAPGRTLGISQIFFDPADIAELRRRYDALGMDYWAQFHALDAIKKQETLMPNLALTWGVPGLDGYGGGITPTRQFALFASLLLPDGAAAVDGRLGERLALPACRGACIPDLRWLRATDTQFIITDYVYDIQHDDIAYDTALARFWADVQSFDPPETTADQLHILYRGPVSGGGRALELSHGHWLRIADYTRSASLLDALQDAENILAVTLVDSRNPQAFLQLQPPPFERVYADAVKIYRRATSERAFLAGPAHILPDNEAGDAEALRLLRAGEKLTLQGLAEAPALAEGDGGTVDIIAYDEARVDLRVNAPAPAILVLRDAFYPGWAATVNGEPTPIYRANLLFRAVALPAGESAVVFRFEPALWRAALYIGLALWIIAGMSLLRLQSKETAT